MNIGRSEYRYEKEEIEFLLKNDKLKGCPEFAEYVCGLLRWAEDISCELLQVDDNINHDIVKKLYYRTQGAWEELESCMYEGYDKEIYNVIDNIIRDIMTYLPLLHMV